MNIVKEILQIKKQIKQLYCYLTGTGGTFTESDPTVPQYVKDITELNIAYWNEKREDRNLYITEDTTFSSIGETQLIFNRNIAYALDNLNVDTSDKADLNAGNVDAPNAILWRDALDIYTKAEVDGKFYQGGEESLTEITDISLTANVLYISYVGENGNTQTKSVDLSGLATIDIHIEDATYNAATNIITITDNDGNDYNIDLSEFSIITETDINGVTTLTQEAVVKLTVSKVGQTGQYSDLIGVPTPIDISGKLDKPLSPNNVPSRVILGDGTTKALSDITVDLSNVTGQGANMVNYWTGTNWLSAGVEWIKLGFLKVTSLILTPNAGTALPNELGTDGTNVVFGVAKRKIKYADITTVFVYTATGNFNISTVKTALEATGMIFNDCHIIVEIGTGTYICNINIGLANPNKIFTVGKRGTGTLAFTSTRVLDAGIDNITLINGADSSMAKIEFNATKDFINIRNT